MSLGMLACYRFEDQKSIEASNITSEMHGWLGILCNFACPTEQLGLFREGKKGNQSEQILNPSDPSQIFAYTPTNRLSLSHIFFFIDPRPEAPSSRRRRTSWNRLPWAVGRICSGSRKVFPSTDDPSSGRQSKKKKTYEICGGRVVPKKGTWRNSRILSGYSDSQTVSHRMS